MSAQNRPESVQATVAFVDSILDIIMYIAYIYRESGRYKERYVYCLKHQKGITNNKNDDDDDDDDDDNDNDDVGDILTTCIFLSSLVAVAVAAVVVVVLVLFISKIKTMRKEEDNQ